MQCSSENTLPEDDNQSTDNPSKEMVLYKRGIDDDIKNEPVQDSKGHKSLSLPRISPSIGAFTVQCSRCFHWRLIPTKEKYEEIREKILDDPFFCEKVKEWGRDISCDDASDISQDSSRLWAIDKPGIARPPSGWERLLRIRGEGGVKFADVYYVAPCGKRMRSTVEVQKYLSEHPEYLKQGSSLSQFTFQCPKPLQENYLRKRPARLSAPADGIALETPKSSTDGQDVDTDLPVGRPESSTLPTNKKSKSSKKQVDDANATLNQLDVKLDDS